MSDYIKHKEYKLPNGRTVTADFNELGEARVTIQAMDALFDILNSSDVRENVRGEWIEDNPRNKSMMWRCSVCGRIAYYPTIGERKSYKKHCGYNFCPNCGADMRREDNGRDEENHNRV